MSPTPTTGDSPSTTTATAIPSCTTGVPDKYGHVSPDSCNANYAFYPNFAANCAIAVLFGLTFTTHFIQAIAWKKRFCWVLLMGVSWETTAFIVRTLGSRDQQNMAYAIAGQLFFLLAPLWINAFAYMTVARLVYYSIADQSVWRAKATWLTQIFVWIDILCFIVQAGGGMMMSNTDASTDDPIIRKGQQVYMAGCGAQLGFILVFSTMMIRVIIKMNKQPRMGANMTRAKMLFFTMCAVLVLIVMRIIFRLVEFGPGATSSNPILSHEGYAIGLDAVPMLLATFLLNAVHPGWVLRGPDSDFPRLTRAEKKAKKQEKKEAKQQAKEEKKMLKSKKKQLGGNTFVALEEGASSSDELEMEQSSRPQQQQQQQQQQPLSTRPYDHTYGYGEEYATYEDIRDTRRV